MVRVSRCVVLCDGLLLVCVVQAAGLAQQRAQWQHPVDAGQIDVSTVSSIVCAVVGDGVCSGVRYGVADSCSRVPRVLLWLLWAAALCGRRRCCTVGRRCHCRRRCMRVARCSRVCVC
jgi:hypothetical protein